MEPGNIPISEIEANSMSHRYFPSLDENGNAMARGQNASIVG